MKNLVSAIIGKSNHLEGEIQAPPSKAYTHRMLVSALLSNGVSEITNPLDSNDTRATLEAIRALGAETELERDHWKIQGTGKPKATKKPINCGASGATLRFMIPVAALSPGSTVFTSDSSLKRRPVKPLLQTLNKLGIKSLINFKEEPSSIIVYGGEMVGGKASIRGDLSSQFISGLMFACPLARKDCEIVVTTRVESKGYIEMTREILDKHDVIINLSDDLRRLNVPSNQRYRPCNHEVPGDFSSAAFLLAAAAITSSKIRVSHLDYSTTQGDRRILNILKDMGSNIRMGNDHVEVEGKKLDALNVDARDIPDLIPVCAALACYCEGVTTIYNAKRLRLKESDRLASLHSEFQKMGADITVEKEALIIRGPCELHGATISPHNDHRIAMSCAIIALGAKGDTKIRNSDCVKKSYPRFFQDLISLGANVIER